MKEALSANRLREVLAQALPDRTLLQRTLNTFLRAQTPRFVEAVEAIPELEFDQTANLAAEAGHYPLVGDAGGDAELIPELEFDQTLGW